jgi:DedD protein
MRSTFEEEDELAQAEARRSQPDREFTLSTGTLLGIFFGLVLVCALFFVFGYTVGRRSSSDAGQVALASGVASSPMNVIAPSQAKPSAASAPAQAAAAPETDPATTNADGAGDTSAAPATKETSSDGNAATVTALAPVTAAGFASGGAVAEPVGVMVQIAAVSNSADADVLVSALHKRGYAVTVRRDPADTLMHVQIGPFANRADAVTMRQKLLGDGYNAILK